MFGSWNINHFNQYVGNKHIYIYVNGHKYMYSGSHTDGAGRVYDGDIYIQTARFPAFVKQKAFLGPLM